MIALVISLSFIFHGLGTSPLHILQTPPPLSPLVSLAPLLLLSHSSTRRSPADRLRPAARRPREPHPRPSRYRPPAGNPGAQDREIHSPPRRRLQGPGLCRRQRAPPQRVLGLRVPHCPVGVPIVVSPFLGSPLRVLFYNSERFYFFFLPSSTGNRTIMRSFGRSGEESTAKSSREFFARTMRNALSRF